METEYEMLMPFKNDDENFTLGFECGKLYSEMEQGKKIEYQLIHSENAEQIKLICSRFGYSCNLEPVNEDWFNLFAEILN